MKFNKVILIMLISSSLVSCEKVFMHPNPEISNVGVFEEYAKICIEKFGLQEVKQINLPALVDSIRPLINENLSEDELFDMMSIITLRMREGHTKLTTIGRGRSTSYFPFAGYPSAMNFLLANSDYYNVESNTDWKVLKSLNENDFFDIDYGLLPQDKTIGYIRIVSFNMEVSDEQLDEMMEFLKDTKGLIIDVRVNLGGYIDLTERIASYFTDKKVLVGTKRVKNGPEENNFVESEMYIRPSNSLTYENPVMVLHDRVTFSSGSLFVLAMRAMPNITTVGQILGGGTGDIMDGYLQNGWYYSISTSNFIDYQGRPTDNGIEPDIPIVINPDDIDTETVIERAIQELQK